MPATNHLPPPAPRRITPIRRAFTANLEGPPTTFQTRPLKNLTVLSRTQHTIPTRSMTRSPSPSLSTCSNSTRSCATPRRVFPQTPVRIDLDDLEDKEEAPVVFDANLTFVLGCKTNLKQNFKPVPAHRDRDTVSNVLSNKIADFLERTDHVMDEWKSMGHKEDGTRRTVESIRRNAEDRRNIGRSSSATNILIKGFQYFSRASSCNRSSVTREASEDRTEAQADEVLDRDLLDLSLKKLRLSLKV